MFIPATHLPTGHRVHVVQTMSADERGPAMVYIEDSNRPSVAGWTPASRVRINA